MIDKEDPDEALKYLHQAERIYEQLGVTLELAKIQPIIAEIKTKRKAKINE